MQNAFLCSVFEKNSTANAFSRQLSRIFPNPEKDFFSNASTTRNKEKCANALNSSERKFCYQ
ncbi:MAG: hypothetical protein E2590_05515 [Chryseobacterium sp.]|nr:hypothetical protein [Chryseobacterium sp.]